MSIQTSYPQAATALITVDGDLDINTAPDLKQELAGLLQQGVNQIVVDLSATDHVDSTGLGVLVAAMRRVTSHGGTLKLVGNPRIRRIFEMTSLTKIFELYEAPEEALDSLSLAHAA